MEPLVWWFGYLLLSWLAADFLSGFFHWFEDRYLDESTPILGRLVGGPNALHHVKPLAMLEGSYWHRNWTTIMPAGLVAVAFWFINPYLCLPWLMLTQANEIHAWSHQKGKVHVLIGLLQQMGVVQSPDAHAEHHRQPFDCRYCVMSNLLNPVLDHCNFWCYLELLMLELFGLELVK